MRLNGSTKQSAGGTASGSALRFAGLMLALSLPLALHAQSGPGSVTCASDDGRRNFCSADTRGGVLIERELSGGACVQGTTWGYNRRGIWVDQGCRAQFNVRPYAYIGRETEKVVATGTTLSVRTNETIDAHDNNGRIYSGVVSENVLDQQGRVAIPAGSPAELMFRADSQGDLILDLESVIVNGERYAPSVDPNEVSATQREGLGANQRTAEYVGGGALLGTIIGAIAGGGKGAAIGAAVGAGAGAGTQVLTRGRRVQIPAESVITFRLDQTLYIGIADNGYDRGGAHYHYPETIFPNR